MSQIWNHVKIQCAAPQIGMGATVFHYTDRSPATVVKMSESGKTVWIQVDQATRTDENGMSELQAYEYTPNPKGELMKVTLRRDGQWRVEKKGLKVAFGRREKYHDFSF